LATVVAELTYWQERLQADRQEVAQTLATIITAMHSESG
jgi:hypothetical protein